MKKWARRSRNGQTNSGSQPKLRSTFPILRPPGKSQKKSDRGEEMTSRLRGKGIIIGIAALLCAIVFHAAVGKVEAQRQFARKDCLDCHTKFAGKYLGMKSVHAIVKDKKCEDCHLRHGVVPKLLLKKEGNELCYTCHAKEKLGMNLPNVHTALKTGQCTICHNPHAAPAANLLKAEGSE